MNRTTLLSAMTLAICSSSGLAQIHPSHQVIVATNVSPSEGALSVVETASPYPVNPLAEKASHDSIVRVFNGQLYVLGRDDRTVCVRELPSLKLIDEFKIAEVVAPRDIVMVDSYTALISDYDSKNLWWLDTQTGVLSVGPNLAAYSDPDGLPDVSMMEAHGGMVYVQLQRFDRNTYTSYGAKLAVLAPGFNPNPPLSLLYVIDLLGVRPDFRMQVNDAGNRLWISAPGVDGDWGFANTGVEEVDLNTHTSLGFVVTESQLGADLGPFVMIDDNKGFAIAHTSIIASTHLRVFTRAAGQLAELHVGPGRLETIAYDRVRRHIFYPVAGYPVSAGGVLIFDADNHTQLSPLRPVGGDPFDMVVVQG